MGSAISHFKRRMAEKRISEAIRQICPGKTSGGNNDRLSDAADLLSRSPAAEVLNGYGSSVKQSRVCWFLGIEAESLSEAI
jgi:hypothetical protein